MLFRDLALRFRPTARLATHRAHSNIGGPSVVMPYSVAMASI